MKTNAYGVPAGVTPGAWGFGAGVAPAAGEADVSGVGWTGGFVNGSGCAPVVAAGVAAGTAPLVFVAAGGAGGCGWVPGTGAGPGLLTLGTAVAAGVGDGAAGALEAELAGAGVAGTATGAGDGWPTVGFDAGGLLSFVLPGVFASCPAPLSGEVGAAEFCGGD